MPGEEYDEEPENSDKGECDEFQIYARNNFTGYSYQFKWQMFMRKFFNEKLCSLKFKNKRIQKNISMAN